MGRNFIELLEVDRPNKLLRHDYAGNPPIFSFGDHNRLAVTKREGLAMLVFATTDARADVARFKAAGLQFFRPFEFERQARPANGKIDTIGFTLGFARSPDMPGIGFFVCETRAQQYFWQPEFQAHANGAQGISVVYLSSPSPQRDGQFISRMFGGDIAQIQHGISVACGQHQEVHVVTPAALTELDSSLEPTFTTEPLLAGIRVVSHSKSALIPSTEGCGAFIEFVRANESDPPRQ